MCLVFSLIEVHKDFSAFHLLSMCCFLCHQLFGKGMMSIWMRAGGGRILGGLLIMLVNSGCRNRIPLVVQTTGMRFLIVLEASSLRPWCQGCCFWWGLSSWLADGSLLTQFSHGLSSKTLEESLFSGVSSYRDTNPIRLIFHQPHPVGSMTSFNVNYLIRGSISKYVYTGG